MGGVGTLVGFEDGEKAFTAIPYYAVGNRVPGSGYTTWIQANK